MEMAEDDAGGLSVFKLLKLKRDPKEFTLRESANPPQVNEWVIKLSQWLASDVTTEKLSHIINTQMGISRITYDVTMRDKYRQCGASFNLDATDHCIPLRNEMDQLLQYISTRHVGSVTQVQHLKTEVETFLEVITKLEKGMVDGEVKAGRVKLSAGDGIAAPPQLGRAGAEGDGGARGRGEHGAEGDPRPRREQPAPRRRGRRRDPRPAVAPAGPVAHVRAVGALGQFVVADAVDRERDAVRARGGALVAARPHHPQGLLEARPRRLPARDGVDGALLL